MMLRSSVPYCYCSVAMFWRIEDTSEESGEGGRLRANERSQGLSDSQHGP